MGIESKKSGDISKYTRGPAVYHKEVQRSKSNRCLHQYFVKTTLVFPCKQTQRLYLPVSSVWSVLCKAEFVFVSPDTLYYYYFFRGFHV